MAGDNQTIFRVHRGERDRWTPVLNETLRDTRLSFKATGILTYLLSLPGDWEVNQSHLSKVKTDGRDAVIAGFKELQECGYIEKQFVRDAKGQIVKTIWHVFESPKSDLPKSGFPISGFPISENPTQRKTEENERLTQTNILPASLASDESSIQSKVKQAEAIYAAYPRRVGGKKAVAKILTALKDVPFAQLLATVQLYAAAREGQNPKFTPHPATWFEQGRYNDDPEEWNRTKRAAPAPEMQHATAF